MFDPFQISKTTNTNTLPLPIQQDIYEPVKEKCNS